MTTDSQREEVHDSRGWMEDAKDRDLLISLEHGLLLRVKVAAILLGIGRTTMYELIRRGQIAVVRIGRRTPDSPQRFGRVCPAEAKQAGRRRPRALAVPYAKGRFVDDSGRNIGRVAPRDTRVA
jgi:excisionase family DNA binding protein